MIQYSCRNALSVRAIARCTWLRVGDYLYLRVTRDRESLANLAQSCAIISQKRKTICQTLVTLIRYCMRNLYNLSNLARKVCCKKCFMLNFHARLMSTCMSNLIASITAWSLQVFILNACIAVFYCLGKVSIVWANSVVLSIAERRCRIHRYKQYVTTHVVYIIQVSQVTFT